MTVIRWEIARQFGEFSANGDHASDIGDYFEFEIRDFDLHDELIKEVLKNKMYNS